MEPQLVVHSVDATELSLPIAGLGSRSYAFIIDWHIRVLAAVLWILVIALFQPLSLFAFLKSGKFAAWVTLLPAAVFYFLYHPVLETVMRGRTPGKRRAGIRIVNTQGQTPGTGALIMRNVFRLIDALPAFYLIGLGVALLTARGTRIGDLAAGTLLVYEQQRKPQGFDLRLPGRAGLKIADVELLEDLLDRWRVLDKEARRRLAVSFLRRVGSPVNDAAQRTDAWLRERLEQILKECRRDAPH